jgi:hypothetical protein
MKNPPAQVKPTLVFIPIAGGSAALLVTTVGPEAFAQPVRIQLAG